MTRKIPPDAFEQYVQMGHARSYRELAKELDVTARAICYRAADEGWQERLEAIEAEARAEADRRLVKELFEMRLRHMKTLKVMSARAIEAMKTHSLETAMEGARVAQMAIELERKMVQEAIGQAGPVAAYVEQNEVDQLLLGEGEQDDAWDE